MTADARGAAQTSLVALRREVRRRAVANVTLILLDVARRCDGRLGVRALDQDTLLLEYRDVGSLARVGELFRVERRDFAVLLACPSRWPLDRAAPITPLIITPDDFAHPNSDGHGLCIDLEGVVPERIPALLYDNLRLRRYRLDHCVDAGAAAFVRGHLELFPADPRRLHPMEGS